MKKLLLVLLLLVAGCVDRPPVLTVQDRAGLGAHLTYVVVTHKTTSPDKKPDGKPGDPCPECGGRGKQGDGTVEQTCLSCKGTGKILPKSQDAKANAVETSIELKPVIQAWSNKSLPDSIEQDKKKKIMRRSTFKWTVNQKKEYTTEELAEHLLREHNTNTIGYSREEMEIMHDNLHNGFTAYGEDNN
jgi:RecJ-like exonuclease